MYEITVASSRRSFQLSKLYDAGDETVMPGIDENEGKIVSLAAQQIFTKEIDFRMVME